MFERFGKDVRRVAIRAAEQEAQALGSQTVEAEHLLLALAAEHGPAGRLLSDSGLDHEDVCAALERETERSLAAVGVDASDFGLSALATPPPSGRGSEPPPRPRSSEPRRSRSPARTATSAHPTSWSASCAPTSELFHALSRS